MAKRDKGTLYKERMFRFIENRDKMPAKERKALSPSLQLLTKEQVIKRARTIRQRKARKITRKNS